MVGVKGRIPVNHRILMGFDNQLVELSSTGYNNETLSLTVDTVFGFLDVERSPESCSSSDDNANDIEDDDSGEVDNTAERTAFWEAQHQLLHATLTRSSSLESGIRNATKLALKEAKLSGINCVCTRPLDNECRRNCLLRNISDRLRNVGYNSAICKSKWRSSPHIPLGEHMYIDVSEYSSSKKGEIKVVIELNFRAEFEMARASEEYNRLSNRLPEVYVGKSERLRTLIKIMCSAAKKCMKENKMHMGPWRKQKYMEAKWFGTCERTMSSAPITPKGFSDETKKQRMTSLLTFDLGENLHTLNCRAVKVV